MEEIDDDSYYCDQCGVEVYVCTSCHAVVNSKYSKCCGQLAAPAVSVRRRIVENDKDEEEVSRMESSRPQGVDYANVQSSITKRLSKQNVTAATVPSLRLQNHTLGIDIHLDGNAVMGRNSGKYTTIFEKHGDVSRKHCSFQFDETAGWTVTDLGSSWGTHYNGDALASNKPQAISNESMIKIASIEFLVTIGE